MMNHSSSATPSVTIQEAAAGLGVPASTMRSWERRYGLPRVSRTRGWHRRYNAEALNELRLMRDEIARGKRAAEDAIGVRDLLAPAEPAADFVNRLLTATDNMDQAGVRDGLDDTADHLGLAAAVDEVLLPVMRRVGRWGETGRCDVGREHLVQCLRNSD